MPVFMALAPGFSFLSVEGSGFAYFDPFLLPRRLQYGIQHKLRPVGIAEIWLCRFAFGHPFEEIRHLVDETVFVADLQARHPPFAHVGMVTVGHMNRAPAADDAWIAMVEILQPMEV